VLARYGQGTMGAPVFASYTPMGPTQVREPFHREGWVYEEKVDGWRMLAYKDGVRVRLVSRNGRDHTQRFAGIAAAVAKLSARSLVLDGEVAIFDEKLRSRFDWLREPDPDAAATPPMLMVFDLLHQDGRDLTGRPLGDRRARLENVVAGSDLVLPVRRLAKNGFEAWWSEVIARGGPDTRVDSGLCRAAGGQTRHAPAQGRDVVQRASIATSWRRS
jgi:ATP-dependent DNA ligase